MTGTFRLQAYSIAARANDVLFTVASASCTTCAPLSTANTTPWAKRFASAMKLSPTRTGRTMQFGQLPSPPPMSASAVASRAVSRVAVGVGVAAVAEGADQVLWIEQPVAVGVGNPRVGGVVGDVEDT